jgi:hypothetical protein
MVRFLNGIRKPDKFVLFLDASLDHLYIKIIFFCIKRSRLAGPFQNQTILVRFSNGLAAILHSITGLKKRQENSHSKTGRLGFQMLTVSAIKVKINFINFINTGRLKSGTILNSNVYFIEA